MVNARSSSPAHRETARQALPIPPSSYPDRPHLCDLPHLLVDHPTNRILTRHPLMYLPSPVHPASRLAPGQGPVRECMGDQWVPGITCRALDHELYLVLDGL